MIKFDRFILRQAQYDGRMSVRACRGRKLKDEKSRFDEVTLRQAQYDKGLIYSYKAFVLLIISLYCSIDIENNHSVKCSGAGIKYPQ